MKTGTIVLIGAAALAAYYFQQLNVAGQTVQFVFSGIQFLTPTRLQIQLMVQNISNANVTLYGMTGNVSVNGNDIGSASDFTQTDIAPTSQQQINLILDLNILSLPSTIMSLINQTGKNYNFQVTGNANINHLVIPFAVTKSISI